MIKFELSEKMFGSRVMVITDCSQEAMVKYLKKKHNITHKRSDFCNGQYFITESGRRFIWVEKFDSSPFWIGVAVHEIMHYTVSFLSDAGIAIKNYYENGDAGDETAAYFLRYFTSAYLTELNLHLIKKNGTRRAKKGSGKKG
jgi:hypothetical protein